MFFDFSGYSLCAAGTAYCLGFRVVTNFRAPYSASSLSDFWRRWHISLSTWLRDYLFLPLAYRLARVLDGRCFYHIPVNNVFCSYAIATLTTMTLAGLWHGANWTFVLWGLYFGLGMVLEHVLQNLIKKLWRPLKHGYTLLVIVVGWVIFRASNLSGAGQLLKAMFGFNTSEISNDFGDANIELTLFTMALLIFWHHVTSHRRPSLVLGTLPRWALVMGTGFVLASLFIFLIAPESQHVFIYFQF